MSSSAKFSQGSFSTPCRGARRFPRFGTTVIATVLLALVMAQIGSGQASARDRAESTATVTGLTQVDGTLWEMTVDSPTMGTVPFQVIRPNGAPADAPTLYLLNGAGGGEDGANWLAQTDAQQFFADKFVNVLIPARGLGSYYTDWIAADPRMGQPMWATLLTDELPAAVDDALATNGRNAIAGLSMSATSVLDLATTAPGLYRSVASYSGCARTSTPEGEAAVRGIVYAAAGGNADNMWGPTGSPLWRQHDPYVNAEKLRGTRLYLSSGSGAPGRHDTPSAQAPGAPPIANQILVGGALEAATRACTEAMAKRLRQLSIPAQVHLPSTGTHSWGYWQDELHRSWPTLAAGLDG